jgi:autotransporter passenger strand-loop-strand repeat protein
MTVTPTTIVKVGTEFEVNTQTAGGQWYPVVTGLANGGFVVTWQDGLAGNDGSGSGTLGDNSFSSIKAQMYDAAGAKVGSEFLVNTQTTGGQAAPSITALSSGGFVVTWQDSNSASGDIKAQIFNANGTPSGAEFRVNTVTTGNQNTSTVTALATGGFVVAWTDQNANNAGEVKAQMFNAAGTKVGGEFLVNSANAFDQERASITALSNGDFVVSWNDFRTGDWAVRAQVFHPTASGATKVGGEVIVSNAFYNNRMTSPITALSNGNFAVSWEDTGGEVRTALYTATGTKIGSDFQVNTQTGGNQGFPSITALSNGGFVVTWSDEGPVSDGSSSSIKAQMFDANGVKIGGEYLINSQPGSNQLYPTVAGLAGGGFVVTWQDFSQALGDTSAYGITAQIFGVANSPGAPAIVSVSDDVAPLTGTLAGGASTNDTNLTVRIATGSNFPGDVVRLFDGSTQLGDAITLTIADVARGYIDVATGVLSNATHAITANVTDASGLQSPSATTFAITVDTVAPVVAVTATVSDPANLTHVTVNGTAGAGDAGRTVQVFDGNTMVGTTTVGNDGSWSLADVTLTQGTNNLSAKVTDLAGNTGTSAAFAGPYVVSGSVTTVSTATATDYIVVNSGVLEVANGGTVSGTIEAGGDHAMVFVRTGGTTLDAHIGNGAVMMDNGSAIGTVIASGGIQHVNFGGTASGTTIEAGGYQDVFVASVSGTTVSGYQQVVFGGTAIDSVVTSGGYEYIGAGGATDGTTVNAGGLEYVAGGGTATGTVVNGTQYVAGSAVDATIGSGGIQYDAGSATGTIVSDGGKQLVQNGGTATDSVVNAGGLQSVEAGGTTSGTTLNGGFEFVAGTANATTVNGGGHLEVVSGGVANGTQLSSGDEHVYAGGTANDVDFTGPSATLFLDDPSSLTGTISDFGVGDTIDFLGTSFSSYTFDGTTLTLATAGGANYAYQFANTEAGTTLNLHSDGNGGTSVSLSLLSQFSANLGSGSDSSDSSLVPNDPTPAPAFHAAT